MGSLKGVFDELNIVEQCKRYNLSLWQCPQFLFLAMGGLICFTAVGSFVAGTHYGIDPVIVALMVLIASAILLIIAFFLIQGFERLAEANRMKSEFVNIVSHQLRSPLSNLSWALEFLMSGSLGGTQKDQADYFKILKQNISRMKELISDLILVSRIEDAGLILNKKPFSLGEKAKEIISDFEALIRASNMKLEFKIEEGLPMVMADSDQVGEVIKKLLDNAIRYIKEKGVVKVQIKKEGKQVCFKVSDNGVGIPEPDQKFIFQKFFRSKNILKQQTHGSGLGLFIAKAITQRSGGRIDFKSREGKGSTFWFTLPTKT